MGRSLWLPLALGSVALIPLRTPQEAQRPTAIALGSFDGLHQGHRRVIAAVTGSNQPQADAEDKPPPALIPTVVSFWPHPREVLYGEPRLRLDLPAEKLELLEPLGIRQLVLVPFDRQLAAVDPETFVDQVLACQLEARLIAVGSNFRFGVDRRGDTTALQRLGAARGIRVVVVPMLEEGGEQLSSSRIRRALAAADLAEARRLLGRPYRFSGPVVSGRGLGRQLGWPTANVQVDGRKCLPQEGVYAAMAQVDSTGAWLPSVMNLGPQPTVDPKAPSAVEVHLLDRMIELEGHHLRVEPLALLRHQQRFADVSLLSRQIALDAAEARLLTDGVGVGQTPGHEGSDRPQQQNS